MIRDGWSIVGLVKQDLGIDANTHDLKLFGYALNTYRDLNLANIVKTAFKTRRLPVIPDTKSLNHCVNLPDDYVDYYKIGLCVGGYIHTLDANDNICLAPNKVDCCGEELAQLLQNDINNCCGNNAPQAGGLPYPYWTYDFLPYFKNGQFIAGAYGQSAHRYRGGYRIDTENRQIILDRCVKATEIVLEYESEGFDDYGNFIVPYNCVDAMRYGVHEQRCLFSKFKEELSMSEKMGKKYRKHVQRANARNQALTKSEILAIYQESIYQGPKR